MSYEDSEEYCFDGRDRALVASAEVLLRKVVSSNSLRPAEMVSVAKVLHVISRVPKTTGLEMNVSVSVVGPRRRFGEIETYHWWEVGVEGKQLSIGSGGHFFRPSSGGDTFTTMEWYADPGMVSVFSDFRADLAIVPDVKSFPEAVASLVLTKGEFDLEISDPDNPLLEETGSAGEKQWDNDLSESVEHEAGGSWSVDTKDAAEEKLAALIKPDEVESNEAEYANDVSHCDVCGGSLSDRSLFVDGRLRENLMWANMCAQCFFAKGAGVGWGSGQLYARQADGSWRMVAGFKLSNASDQGGGDY